MYPVRSTHSLATTANQIGSGDLNHSGAPGRQDSVFARSLSLASNDSTVFASSAQSNNSSDAYINQFHDSLKNLTKSATSASANAVSANKDASIENYEKWNMQWKPFITD